MTGRNRTSIRTLPPGSAAPRRALPASRAGVVAVAALAMAGLLGTAGCSSGSGSGGSGSSGPGSASSGGGVAASPSSGTGPAGPATSTPGPASTEAVATRTATFAAPGRSSGTLSVGLVSLRVDGRLANLTLTFTPHFTGTPATEEISIYKMFDQAEPDVALIDTTNLKRYVVVQDTRGHYLESDSVETRTTNGRPVTGTYTFAAPPASVSTVDIYVSDRDSFSSVPVGR